MKSVSLVMMETMVVYVARGNYLGRCLSQNSNHVGSYIMYMIMSVLIVKRYFLDVSSYDVKKIDHF